MRTSGCGRFGILGLRPSHPRSAPYALHLASMTHSAAQMLNPAPRASIVSALLQPQSFLSASSNDATPQRLPIWKLPDASILFRRYLEAGRMINVYDWYDSFSQAVESQRGQLFRDGGESGSGADEEEWKMHVQARFMRALHTLDLIGLIKHTGRKADHVMRTVFDMPE